VGETRGAGAVHRIEWSVRGELRKGEGPRRAGITVPLAAAMIAVAATRVECARAFRPIRRGRNHAPRPV